MQIDAGDVLERKRYRNPIEVVLKFLPTQGKVLCLAQSAKASSNINDNDMLESHHLKQLSSAHRLLPLV